MGLFSFFKKAKKAPVIKLSDRQGKKPHQHNFVAGKVLMRTGKPENGMSTVAECAHCKQKAVHHYGSKEWILLDPII